MRVTSSLLALSAFAAGALARAGPPRPAPGKPAPPPAPVPAPRGPACMNDAQAQQVATNFKNLIAQYSDALADAAMTPDFQDYSDSVIELINSGCTGPVALGSATFNSLAAFKAGQSAQPPIPFEQLNIWHTCDTVIIRWKSAQTPEQIIGNIVMETVPAPAGNQFPFQIQTVYSEFNSGAWLVNLGVFTPSNCSAGFQPVVTAPPNVVNNKRDVAELPTVL